MSPTQRPAESSSRSGWTPWIPGLALALGLAGLPGGARAAGFGGYVDYAHAEGNLDYQIIDADYDADKVSVGFLFDSNAARDRLLNYRLALGYQYWDRHFDAGGKLDAHGVTMNHSLGFGLFRSPRARLWVGPALRLSFDFVDDDVSGVKVYDVSVGGGPQLGINLHAGERVSISLAASYQYLYVGEIFDTSTQDATFDGHEHLFTVGVGILFRTRADAY